MNRDSRIANWLLLILAAAALTLLSLQATAKVAQLRAVVAYLLEPLPYHGDRLAARLEAVPAGAARIIAADVELVEARRRLQEAEVLKAELSAARVENERLAVALGMRPLAGRTVRWARVMERDPQNWYRSVLIDAGEEQGIDVNAPVLGLDGSTLAVVGRVTEVNPRTAKVLLLSDELSALAAYFPTQGWEGLVQGQGTTKLRMNYLPVDAKFAVGDEVHTSPTSASFPPGLMVGRVSRVFQRDPFLAFQAVELERAVAAGRLKEVMVLAPLTEPAVPTGASR
ncbi:MAG: rod shape-determining protein MreC [Elusimicrobia bacterium]|nr:rod shape-determining protein MreC [Elusimicrobiota bacterium]